MQYADCDAVACAEQYCYDTDYSTRDYSTDILIWGKEFAMKSCTDLSGGGGGGGGH